MPTGYTAKLMESGESFPDFVMRCSRAFGALVSLREESADYPIPTEIKPDYYYAESLKRAKSRYEHLADFSESQKFAYGRKEKESRLAGLRVSQAKSKLEDGRLLDMEKLVNKWEPPSKDHQGLKNFMLQQLGVSKNGSGDDYYCRSIKQLETKSPMSFYIDSLKSACDDIAYYQEKVNKEIERCKENTTWVKTLRDSLVK